MKAVRIVLIVLIAVFVGLQLVPVERKNPETTMEAPAPDEVRAVLRRSCYDCHSNETQWPWYAYVAPLSWRIARHVEDGRRHLNFSMWDVYSEGERASLLQEAIEEVEKGKMPLDDYLRLHADARVSDADLGVLAEWVATMAEPEAGPD